MFADDISGCVVGADAGSSKENQILLLIQIFVFLVVV
jgi:hypothetical protein